jgi:hypothetical protein
MISNDGGVVVTLNRGKTWSRISLPIAQMYHVSVDNEIPYNVSTPTTRIVRATTAMA